MPSQPLADLLSEVERAKGLQASATTFISGAAARLQAALDEAVKNGASAAELAPVQGEVDSLKASGDALAAALAANP